MLKCVFDWQRNIPQTNIKTRSTGCCGKKRPRIAGFKGGLYKIKRRKRKNRKKGKKKGILEAK